MTRLNVYKRCFFFFFFKQKTAYEMLRSLVGSEMCIRDRCHRPAATPNQRAGLTALADRGQISRPQRGAIPAAASVAVLAVAGHGYQISREQAAPGAEGPA